MEKLELVERVDALIRRRATGSPKQLAQKLELSERCIYDLLGLIKQMDGPIYYCQTNESYCYEYEVELELGFRIKNDKKIIGGIKNNIPTANFMQWKPIYLHYNH